MAAETAFIATPVASLRGNAVPPCFDAVSTPARTSRPSLESQYSEGAFSASSATQFAGLVTAAAIVGRRAARRGAKRHAQSVTTTTTTTVTTTTTTTEEGGSGAPSKLNVGIIGYGNVGKEFARQLLEKRGMLKDEIGTNVEVVALSRSTQMVLTPSDSFGLELSGGKWPEGEKLVFKDLLGKSDKERKAPLEGDVVTLAKMGEHLAGMSTDGDRAIIIDCTSSRRVADLYADFAAKGIHIVSLNTAYGTGPYKRYEEIIEAGKNNNAYFMAEETLGAGLPIVSQLQGLVRAGDKINTIRIYSDTPAYIFKTWASGKKFSEVVADARKQGLDGGDVKNYLSCRDLRRMLNILARAIGVKMTTSFVKTEFLLPDKLWSFQAPAGSNASEAFMKELANYDTEMDAKMKAAAD